MIGELKEVTCVTSIMKFATIATGASTTNRPHMHYLFQ